MKPSHYTFLQLIEFLYSEGEDRGRQIMYRHLSHCDDCRKRLSGIMRDNARRQTDLDRMNALALERIARETEPTWEPVPSITHTFLAMTRLLIDYTFDS
jgi:hypothetical protein